MSFRDVCHSERSPHLFYCFFKGIFHVAFRVNTICCRTFKSVRSKYANKPKISCSEEGHMQLLNRDGQSSFLLVAAFIDNDAFLFCVSHYNDCLFQELPIHHQASELVLRLMRSDAGNCLTSKKLSRGHLRPHESWLNEVESSKINLLMYLSVLWLLHSKKVALK